jgi:hypothetical protein
MRSQDDIVKLSFEIQFKDREKMPLQFCNTAFSLKSKCFFNLRHVCALTIYALSTQ